MTLFSSIRMAANTLQADQIALQVIAQNIANANTPGYIREEVVLTPAPTFRYGGLLLGLGVQVEAIIQKIDHFLEERLRGAVSDKTSAEAQEETYLELEQLIGELSETDLSTRLNAFFGSIAEVLNQPESRSVRNLVVLQGQTLASEIRRLASRVNQIRTAVNGRITQMADDINRLLEEIRTLNIRITETEGGTVSKSHAVGLRDQRLQALEKLAELISIRVEEQNNGSVTVYCGADYLVSEGFARRVEVSKTTDRGMGIAAIQLVDTQSPLDTRSGQYYGLVYARDQILGGFLDQLDDFARTLIFEFNKMYASGQGLVGFRDVTSQQEVDAVDAPLNQVGLSFQPVNGSFQVLVYNRKTGLTNTTDIRVDLNGIGRDTTLEDIVNALNAINGLSAEITPSRGLRIWSTSSDLEFGFANDTSGLLAALGINTFFTGTTALSIGVNEQVAAEPALLAASRGGIGADTDNAIELARFLDLPLKAKNGDSLAVLYDRLVSGVTQGSAIMQAVAEGSRTFEATLRGQKLALSGVSIDEEAVKMITFQRQFQAAARFIAQLSELFEILVSI
ncbi:MAG: flagellar hook-associated protein FlgK [Thermoguttaceae bacterium]|nr:flagellar hook-associated protein FlgK [Thermoguttaceae bacterium]MDW8038925.1 flagellar hook-associated protein FlgK [Thermoguttaceae bacterium]